MTDRITEIRARVEAEYHDDLRRMSLAHLCVDDVQYLLSELDAARAEIAELREAKKSRDDWRDEALRLREAKPKPVDLSELISLDKVIEHMEHHRWTHTDWATWFETHPDDPAIDAGIGDAKFHRDVEARYGRMIAAVKNAQAELDKRDAEIERLRHGLVKAAAYAPDIKTTQFIEKVLESKP